MIEQNGWNLDCCACHVLSSRDRRKAMMSSTKPEVHNVSQHRERRTKPHPVVVVLCTLSVIDRRRSSVDCWQHLATIDVSSRNYS